MKRITSGLLLGMSLLTPAIVSAKVTVKVPSDVKTVRTTHSLLSDYINSRQPHVVSDSIAATDGTAVFEQETQGPSRYTVAVDADHGASFFISPGEDLTVDFGDLSASSAVVFSGTTLMEGIQTLETALNPIMKESQTLDREAADYGEKLQSLIDRANKVSTDFISSNPDSPAVAYVIMNLDGNDFVTAYEAMTPAAKGSILFPMAEKRYARELENVKMQKLQDELSSGHVSAPEITLEDLSGNNVSLSDFRGKWVIIDFWGSWCGWCIKGFPELKKTYEANKDRLVVFGVDCGDSKEAWKAAVEKYSLPWVNVYNATEGRGNNTVLSAYGVQGFPTKVIVDPEGKIANITTGEDPAFYTILSDLMKK